MPTVHVPSTPDASLQPRWFLGSPHPRERIDDGINGRLWNRPPVRAVSRLGAGPSGDGSQVFEEHANLSRHRAALPMAALLFGRRRVGSHGSGIVACAASQEFHWPMARANLSWLPPPAGEPLIPHSPFARHSRSSGTSRSLFVWGIVAAGSLGAACLTWPSLGRTAGMLCRVAVLYVTCCRG